MSPVLYGFAVKRPPFTSMVTGEDIISGQIACERSLRGTKKVRKSVLEILRSNTASGLDKNNISQKERERVVRSC